jgi:hypothetical protein
MITLTFTDFIGVGTNALYAAPILVLGTCVARGVDIALTKIAKEIFKINFDNRQNPGIVIAIKATAFVASAALCLSLLPPGSLLMVFTARKICEFLLLDIALSVGSSLCSQIPLPESLASWTPKEDLKNALGDAFNTIHSKVTLWGPSTQKDISLIGLKIISDLASKISNATQEDLGLPPIMFTSFSFLGTTFALGLAITKATFGNALNVDFNEFLADESLSFTDKMHHAYTISQVAVLMIAKRIDFFR